LRSGRVAAGSSFFGPAGNILEALGVRWAATGRQSPQVAFLSQIRDLRGRELDAIGKVEKVLYQPSSIRPPPPKKRSSVDGKGNQRSCPAGGNRLTSAAVRID
jgi:hypothetical protein